MSSATGRRTPRRAGRDRPERRPGAHRRARHLHGVGRRGLRRRARRRRPRRPGHHPARRHRLGQAGAAPRRPPGTGSPRRRPSAGRWRCGPTSRPSRWATGCCAAPAPSTARRANSVLAMGPSGCRRTTTTGWSRFYEALGRRPIAAVLPDSAEDALFRAHGWVLESHDHDTVFQLAGVARRRAVACRRRPLAAAELSATTGGHRGRPASATRRPASPRRTPTTGSASAPSRWTRPSARAGLGPRRHGRAAGLGRRARRDHGVPPGPRRQRPGPRALRRTRLRRAPPLPLPGRAA